MAVKFYRVPLRKTKNKNKVTASVASRLEQPA
jgi:hypothetical protein